MSLINDAFRDLESRNARLPKRSDEKEVSVASAAVEPSLALRRPLVILSTITFSIFAVIVGARLATDPVELNVAATDSIVAGAKQEFDQRQQSKKSKRADVRLVGKNPLELPPYQHSNAMATPMLAREDARKTDMARLDVLFLKLEKAVKKNRLSRPQGDNALFYINEIYAIDGKNIDARQWHKEIQKKYIALIQAEISEGSEARAKNLLERAHLFDIEQATLDQFLAAVKQRKSPDTTGAQRTLTAADIPHPSTDTPSKIAESSWTRPSEHQQDLNTVKRVNILMRNNRRAEAQQELLSFISINPSAVNARIYAIDLFTSLPESRLANEVLANTPSYNQAYRYVKARVINMEEGRAKAIRYLLGKHHEEIENTHEKALLAALYHKEKKYRNALSLYSSLQRERPREGRFALGFALAADALSENEGSLRAYRKLLELGHSEEKVMDFARARVAVLESKALIEARAW